MSIKIMSQIWELDLPATEKLIALAFADHANDKGICSPSFARIAWKSGVSKDTVKRIVKRFRAIELLERRAAAGGPGRPALWRISPTKGCILPPFVSDLERSKSVEKSVDSQVKSEGNGVHGPSERGAAGPEMGCTADVPSESKTGILEPEPKAAPRSAPAQPGCGNPSEARSPHADLEDPETKSEFKSELQRLASRKSLGGQPLVEMSDEQKQRRLDELHNQAKYAMETRSRGAAVNGTECGSNSQQETRTA